MKDSACLKTEILDNPCRKCSRSGCGNVEATTKAFHICGAADLLAIQVVGVSVSLSYFPLRDTLNGRDICKKQGNERERF
jgi:hypothetical protein